MTRYDRYLARGFIATFVKIVVALVLLFVVIDLLTHRQDNIGRYDIPWRVALLYYVTFVPVILFEFQLAAMAVLFAGLVVVGRAAQDQELVACISGGTSLWRLMRAPIALAFLLALGALLFGETVGVRAAAANQAIEREYFSKFEAGGRAGVSWSGLGDGWTCHVLKFNREAMTGQDVFVHRIVADRLDEIRADRIYWDADRPGWVIEDGRWFVVDPAQEWQQRVIRITQIPAPFGETPVDLFALDRPAEVKSARELRRDLERAEVLGIPVAKHWADYHVKFARPALCFVMIWLAIPFAVRLRRGGISAGMGVSVAVGVAYMLLFYISMGLGRLELLPPAVAAWLASTVFLAAGIALLRTTPT